MEYNKLASEDSIKKTTDALLQKGYKVYEVSNKVEALNKIVEIIPEGVTIMNGSSVTLEEIGYTDLLKSGNHKWNNLHGVIVSETDRAKQSKLRKEAALSDYYVGSVHVLTEDGVMIIGSNTGSQLPNIVFSSNHLVFVLGSQKIVSNVDEGLKRLNDYIIPLEDKHMHDLYGIGTNLNKLLIFRGENPMIGRTVDIIIVNEILGF